MQLLLLGPQRQRPILEDAVTRLKVNGPVAMITAGWQEHESDDQELNEALGGNAVNLNLYARTHALFDEDPTLFDEHRAKQDELRQFQRFYRHRLNAYMDVYERFLTIGSAPQHIVKTELNSVLDDIRRLDAKHLARVSDNRARFAQHIQIDERPAVQKHRSDVKAILDEVDTVAIAGGHVALLLNRLRFFGMKHLLRDKKIIAWSAGAMALSDLVVLFHDHPAQGQGYAEVLDRGLGLYNGIVPLPRATERLRMNDPTRIAHLAKRFAPARCVPLEAEMWAELATGLWHSNDARLFREDGECAPWFSGVDAPQEMP